MGSTTFWEHVFIKLVSSSTKTEVILSSQFSVARNNISRLIVVGLEWRNPFSEPLAFQKFKDHYGVKSLQLDHALPQTAIGQPGRRTTRLRWTFRKSARCVIAVSVSRRPIWNSSLEEQRMFSVTGTRVAGCSPSAENRGRRRSCRENASFIGTRVLC